MPEDARSCRHRCGKRRLLRRRIVLLQAVWHLSAGMDTFETLRLTAERLRPDHFADMMSLHLDPEVSRYLSGGRPPDETEIYMATKLAHWDQHGFGLWVLRTRDGEFAGRAGIQHVLFDGVAEVDIAYTFRRGVWGQGLATEVALALVDIGLGQLNFPSLIGFASARNVASHRVLEKTGFGFERISVFKGDEIVVYRRSGRSATD